MQDVSNKFKTQKIQDGLVERLTSELALIVWIYQGGMSALTTMNFTDFCDNFEAILLELEPNVSISNINIKSKI